MSESESRTVTFTSSPPKPGSKVRIIGLPLPSGKVYVDAVPLKKRVRKTWQPNERERAILSLPRPGVMSLEKYCHGLDERGILFPEKWQRQGRPTTHREAWESKNERLRNSLKSERRNIWDRLKKRG